MIDWQKFIETQRCDKPGCQMSADFMTDGEPYRQYWCRVHDPLHRTVTVPFTPYPASEYVKRDIIVVKERHGLYGLTKDELKKRLKEI